MLKTLGFGTGGQPLTAESRGGHASALSERNPAVSPAGSWHVNNEPSDSRSPNCHNAGSALKTLRDFYAGFGWSLVIDSDVFVAFQTHGALLALFGLSDLEADAGVKANAPETGLRGFTLAINVDAREEVDATIDAIRKCGGRITKEPVDATLFDGRSAYFADPEDNIWEVVFVSSFRFDEALERLRYEPVL